MKLEDLQYATQLHAKWRDAVSHLVDARMREAIAVSLCSVYQDKAMVELVAPVVVRELQRRHDAILAELRGLGVDTSEWEEREVQA
jgi:hypothetical protein